MGEGEEQALPTQEGEEQEQSFLMTYIMNDWFHDKAKVGGTYHYTIDSRSAGPLFVLALLRAGHGACGSNTGSIKEIYQQQGRDRL